MVQGDIKDLLIKYLLLANKMIASGATQDDLDDILESLIVDLRIVTKVIIYTRESDNFYPLFQYSLEDKQQVMELTPIGLSATFEDISEYDFIESFDIVIPVLVESEPLSYVFLSLEEERSDLYEVVQFMTTILNLVLSNVTLLRGIKGERTSKAETLKREISRGRLEHILDELILISKNSDFENEVLTILSKLALITNYERIGVISIDKALNEKTKIALNILQVLDELRVRR